ncbi:hypothetical protein M3Y96_01111300 [Aphelenchoides besseyi]|nr:hypothetical protein M3Y96_01111300 [Aphelenchoides besseyi]
MVRQTANRFHKISEYASALSAFKEPDQNELKNTVSGFHLHPNPLIDEYFKYVAMHGRTEIDWKSFRAAFLWKLQLTIDDMLLNYGPKNDFEGGDAKENVEKEEKDLRTTYVAR